MSLGFKTQKSKPKLFGPDKLMLEGQKSMWGAAGPDLLDKALQGGYSPEEKSTIYRGTVENINAATKGATNRLGDIYARSGMRGGKFGGDVSDILTTAMGEKGRAWQGVEEMSRKEGGDRMQRLLQAMMWKPPAMLGQTSSSTGANIGLPWG